MTVPPAGPPPLPGGSHPSLDAPLYGATPRAAAERFWRKYATFSGRASRAEFWWWTLIATVVSIVLQLVAAASSDAGFAGYFRDNKTLSLQAWLPWLWTLVTVLPSVALVVRRLHDTNRSGWWYLLSLPSLTGTVAQAITTSGVGSPPAIDPADPTSALVALLPAFALSLIGLVAGVILLVFLISGSDRRGTRFDPRPATIV